MASCVLLLLLSLLLSLVSLFAAAFFFLRAVRKEKSCESTSRENESLCFFFAAVGISFCVSSILLLLGGLILR